jgi:hypothetical protein
MTALPHTKRGHLAEHATAMVPSGAAICAWLAQSHYFLAMTEVNKSASKVERLQADL